MWEILISFQDFFCVFFSKGIQCSRNYSKKLEVNQVCLSESVIHKTCFTYASSLVFFMQQWSWCCWFCKTSLKCFQWRDFENSFFNILENKIFKWKYKIIWWVLSHDAIEHDVLILVITYKILDNLVSTKSSCRFGLLKHYVIQKNLMHKLIQEIYQKNLAIRFSLQNFITNFYYHILVLFDLDF